METRDRLFEEYVNRQKARIDESQKKIYTANGLRTSFERLKNLTDEEVRLENLMANPQTRYNSSSLNIDNRFYPEQFGVHMYQIWRYTDKMFKENRVNIFEGIDMVKVDELGPIVGPSFLDDIVTKRKMNEQLYNRLKEISQEILRFEEANKDALREKRKNKGLANENLYLGLERQCQNSQICTHH